MQKTQEEVWVRCLGQEDPLEEGKELDVTEQAQACTCISYVVSKSLGPVCCNPQAPLSLGFSWPEYRSELSLPSPGTIFPTQGSNWCLPHWQAPSLPLSHQGNYSYFPLSPKTLALLILKYDLCSGWECQELQCAVEWAVKLISIHCSCQKWHVHWTSEAACGVLSKQLCLYSES